MIQFGHESSSSCYLRASTGVGHRNGTRSDHTAHLQLICLYKLAWPVTLWVAIILVVGVLCRYGCRTKQHGRNHHIRPWKDLHRLRRHSAGEWEPHLVSFLCGGREARERAGVYLAEAEQAREALWPGTPANNPHPGESTLPVFGLAVRAYHLDSSCSSGLWLACESVPFGFQLLCRPLACL
jgi:hypothetical protein